MQLRICSVISLLLVLSLMGCGRGGHEKFIPSIESAREALQETLLAWKSGQPYKEIDIFDPKIQPVESRWQQGKQLLDFEIVEELEKTGTKQFRVKLTFADAKAPEETTYIVLGKDPLYVYWITDYEQSSKTM